MKLVSDYRVRYTKWVYLMIIPLIVYFFTFKGYIYDLVAGGIMFMYWTLLVMFINRYFKVWLQEKLALVLGYQPQAYYKTLKPKVVPQKQLTAVDVQKLEGYPILMVMAINFLVTMGLFALVGPANITQIFFGGFILSFNIHYSSISKIVKTLEYPNAFYEYTTISTKIYDTSVKSHAIS